MNSNISLLFPILFPMLCGIAVGLIPALKDEKRRRVFVLAALSISFLLTISQILLPEASLYVCTLTPKAEISFAVDAVTRFFAGLIAFMWLMSGIFSFEYMKHEKNHNRYYCFYLLGEGAMLGVAFAANYVTMYLCFEWMTLMTLPMVLHSQTEDALKAGMKYLLYSFAGAFAGLLGIPFLVRFGTTLDYDNIVYAELSCDINEYSLLWVDADTTDPNDYIVRRVATSLNHKAIAIKKVR